LQRHEIRHPHIAAPIEIKNGDDFVYRSRGHRRKEEEQAITFRLVAINGRDRRGMARSDSVCICHRHQFEAQKDEERLFRKRWAIETSYRMINKFLARTTSRLHLIRILYFYLAVLLYNLWVMLNYHQMIQSRIIADSLKAACVALASALAFIPKLEK
jgi:hypothetical protein